MERWGEEQSRRASERRTRPEGGRGKGLQAGPPLTERKKGPGERDGVVGKEVKMGEER